MVILLDVCRCKAQLPCLWVFNDGKVLAKCETCYTSCLQYSNRQCPHLRGSSTRAPNCIVIVKNVVNLGVRKNALLGPASPLVTHMTQLPRLGRATKELDMHNVLELHIACGPCLSSAYGIHPIACTHMPSYPCYQPLRHLCQQCVHAPGKSPWLALTPQQCCQKVSIAYKNI